MSPKLKFKSKFIYLDIALVAIVIIALIIVFLIKFQ